MAVGISQPAKASRSSDQIRDLLNSLPAKTGEKERLHMAFPKQHDRRSNAFTAQCAQHLERGDDSFDQLEQLVEENKNSKASRRDRRLNERRYKRDPYAE